MIESALFSAPRGGCRNALRRSRPASQRRQQCNVAARSCNKPPADSPLVAFSEFCIAVAREVIPPHRAASSVRQYNHSKFQRSAM
jgi:hypothetical protein